MLESLKFGNGSTAAQVPDQLAKLLPGIPASSSTGPAFKPRSCSPSIQLSADMCLGRQKLMVHITGFLSLTWQTQTEPQVLVVMATAAIRIVNQQTRILAFFLLQIKVSLKSPRLFTSRGGH